MTRRPHITFFEKLSLATYTELFSLWMLINIVCALWYFGLASVASPSTPTHLIDLAPAERLFDSFYFSIITATSIGYGDIVPMGFSKVLAMTQAILALLIFAIFVTKLVSRRQDTILEQVHRMTSENIFSNIREGLFVVRKDFDLLIEELEQKRKPGPQHWDILTTAYLHMQNLIEEIPNLYDGQSSDLYIIDIKREKLLLEAIYRTLVRMEKLLQVMKAHKVDWRKNDESMAEYRAMIDSLKTTMPLWRKKSPSKERVKMFDEVVGMIEKMKTR